MENISKIWWKRKEKLEIYGCASKKSKAAHVGGDFIQWVTITNTVQAGL